MPSRDLVVLGASAGGVEALRSVLAGLPADLPAAVAVVLHLPAGGGSALAGILDRAAVLPVREARDGDPISVGEVVVAVADHHLLVRGDRWRLARGPRESGHRPSIDALLRSAARAAGPRVVAGILSGSLDDGAAGMVAVTSRGGFGIVQDPDDALFPGMPQAAIALDSPDLVVPLAEVAAAIIEQVGREVDDMEEREHQRLRVEDEIAGMEAATDTSRQIGEATPLSCPDCAGVLHEVTTLDHATRFRCVVGHAWGPEALYAEQAEAVERALWIAVRSLEERAALARRMRDAAAARGHDLTAQRFADRAQDEHRQAALLRDLIEGGVVVALRQEEAGA
jgi:two-component system, chemotaxis family, protein-glutamate methylesterase/glutaminase